MLEDVSTADLVDELIEREAVDHVSVEPQLIHKIDDLMQINYWLIFVATGEIRHRYAGQCPDETNNYRARDRDCPACQIIEEAEQAELFQNVGEVQWRRVTF